MLVTLAVIFPQIASAATSLTGTTGLINIPTAYIIPDGKMAFGVGYTDKEYSQHGPKYAHAQVVYYATVGYFPFLEVTLRVTAFPGHMDTGNYGTDTDRMSNLKLRALNESRYTPSILLGVNDFMGSSKHFNFEYVVISKSLHPPFVDSLGIHLGYATNPIKEATHYSMNGMFGGVEIHLCKFLAVMGEYDTKKYNAGLRITLFSDKISIDIDALDMRRVSGGASFSFGL